MDREIKIVLFFKFRKNGWVHGERGENEHNMYLGGVPLFIGEALCPIC